MAQESASEKLIKPQQERLITALLSSPNVTTACNVAGVPRKTAYNWLADSTFQDALKEARKRLFDESLNALQAGLPDALTTLLRHIKADCEPTPGTQMKATTFLYTQSMQTQQVAELAAQVAELKSMLTAMQERNK